MKTDINYINGIIFSAHKNLMTRDKLNRMADAVDAAEAFAVMKEQGYDGADTARDYATALLKEEQKLLDFIRECGFGEEIEAFCLAKNDFFNAECECRARHIDGMKPVYRPDGKITERRRGFGIKSGQSALEKALSRTAERADALFDGATPSGSDVTTVFLRGYYEYALKIIRSSRLKKIIRFEIDAKNISVALRCASSAEFYKACIPGGNIAPEDVAELCGGDRRAAELKFAYTDGYAYIRTALEERSAGKPMTAFEKAADDYALESMDDVRYAAHGKFTAVLYYLYKTAEIKNLRTIMALKLISCPAEEIKRRLRKGYVG